MIEIQINDFEFSKMSKESNMKNLEPRGSVDSSIMSQVKKEGLD